MGNPSVPLLSWSADDLDALARSLRSLNELPELRASIQSVTLRAGSDSRATASAVFETGQWRIRVYPEFGSQSIR